MAGEAYALSPCEDSAEVHKMNDEKSITSRSSTPVEDGKPPAEARKAMSPPLSPKQVNDTSITGPSLRDFMKTSPSPIQSGPSPCSATSACTMTRSQSSQLLSSLSQRSLGAASAKSATTAPGKLTPCRSKRSLVGHKARSLRSLTGKNSNDDEDEMRESGVVRKARYENLDGTVTTRELVAQFFEGSKMVSGGFDELNLPTFASGEIVAGKWLGRGRFSTVEEVIDVRLRTGDVWKRRVQRSNSIAKDDKESRAFIADHCVRPSGEARYAIKQLRPDVVFAKTRAERLNGITDLVVESQFLSALEHPNIIKLRGTADCDPFSKDYYLIMDRLYDTLKQRIYKWKRIDRKSKSFLSRIKDRKGQKKLEFLGLRVSAAHDLSSAMAYLHERSIVHRDIKPENIGFDIRGDIKIFDFGLACELNTRKREEDGTYHLSHMTGSLRYMSPEVALGQTYNAGCDVYSLSLVFWEMLALCRPNDYANEEELIAHVFKANERPQIKRGWPESCKSILERGWEGDLRKRSTITEMTSALRKLVIQLHHGEEDALLEPTSRRSTYVYDPSTGKTSVNNLKRMVTA